MAAKMLFIIKAGSTFAETAARYGDFEEMIRRVMAVAEAHISVVDAPAGECLPPAENCAGVIITGAHCMVTDNLPWSLAIEAWLPSLVKAHVPLLGICYGHQLLARATGGLVDFHPRGKEVGTYPIRLRREAQGDPLFGDLPQNFPVHTSHSQSVLRLPPGSVHLAGNDFEPHHAFRLGDFAWGVQFHPEYDTAIQRDYILAQADSLARDGQQVDRLLRNLQETPVAASILRNFARLALGSIPPTAENFKADDQENSR